MGIGELKDISGILYNGSTIGNFLFISNKNGLDKEKISSINNMKKYAVIRSEKCKPCIGCGFTLINTDSLYASDFSVYDGLILIDKYIEDYSTIHGYITCDVKINFDYRGKRRAIPSAKRLSIKEFLQYGNK